MNIFMIQLKLCIHIIIKMNYFFRVFKDEHCTFRQTPFKLFPLIFYNHLLLEHFE